MSGPEKWIPDEAAIDKMRDDPKTVARASEEQASLPSWYKGPRMWTTFPEAARVHDNVIVHFVTSTTYTLGKHSVHGREMYGVQVFSGSVQNIVTREAAKNLWIGLCLISADWRGLSEKVPENSENP